MRSAGSNRAGGITSGGCVFCDSSARGVRSGSSMIGAGSV